MASSTSGARPKTKTGILRTSSCTSAQPGTSGTHANVTKSVSFQQDPSDWRHLLENNTDLTHKLEIVNIPQKGQGVRAKTLFMRGEFVVEYAGELLSNKEGKERERAYEKRPDVGNFLFFFETSGYKHCVDATCPTGRIGRLVNHARASQGSNLTPKVIVYHGTPRIVLFASKNIEPGEELCYDYNDRRTEALKSFPWLRKGSSLSEASGQEMLAEEAKRRQANVCLARLPPELVASTASSSVLVHRPSLLSPPKQPSLHPVQHPLPASSQAVTPDQIHQSQSENLVCYVCDKGPFSTKGSLVRHFEMVHKHKAPSEIANLPPTVRTYKECIACGAKVKVLTEHIKTCSLYQRRVLGKGMLLEAPPKDLKRGNRK